MNSVNRTIVTFSGVASLVAVAVVAASVVSTPARLGAESGSRACGYILQAASGAVIVQNTAMVIEVDKDSGDSICKKALSKIKDGIQKSGNTLPITSSDQLKSDVPVAQNQWVMFDMKACETPGAYFKDAKHTTDMCDYMNKSSGANNDQHVYTFTLAYMTKGADGKYAKVAAPATTIVEQK